MPRKADGLPRDVSVSILWPITWRIGIAAPQNVRFGHSIQHRQRAARCPPGFV